ncbi:MAG: hypothetical protein R3C55_04535 [Parvularculaceae bacterium]
MGFDPEGFFWLVGQGGYGIQTAARGQRCAATLALGKSLPADVAALGVRKPRSLRRASAKENLKALAAARFTSLQEGRTMAEMIGDIIVGKQLAALESGSRERLHLRLRPIAARRGRRARRRHLHRESAPRLSASRRC